MRKMYFIFAWIITIVLDKTIASIAPGLSQPCQGKKNTLGRV